MGFEEKHYSVERVRVRIPSQKANVVIKVRKLEPGRLPKKPAGPGKFNPRRLIITLDFEDELDPTSKLKKFDPPLVLRVRYTEDDVNRAKDGGGKLRLGYCIEDGAEWQYFTEAKHKFRLVPDGKGSEGEGIVEIRDWEDPAISWGH